MAGHRVTAAVAVISVAGCAQSVTVQGVFPEPVIAPLPLTVGLRYSQALSDYTYSEEVPNDYAWTFEIGAANVILFDTIFFKLFDSAIRLNGEDIPDEMQDSLDAVIEPEVQALEFSLPRQSRTDQYAVWIRYNLNVYAPDGELIESWPVSGYGQSDSRAFKASRSMQQATVKAMRDAAATIALGFEKQRKIRDALLATDNEDPS